MKKIIAIALTAALEIGMTASMVNAAEEKDDLVLMITSSDDAFGEEIEQKLTEKFGDKYNLIFKPWETLSCDQAIKTASIANEQLDIVQYWPGSMRNLVEAGTAMSLNDYMTDEWKAQFTTEDVLQQGTYDDNLYNLPYQSVYPVVVVNTDITDELGITLSEDGQWSWAEFEELCEAAADAGIYGSTIQSDFTPWLSRMAIMEVWDTPEEVDAWNDGQVSFLDEKITGAFADLKTFFDTDSLYPGADACLAQDADQTIAAFSTGKAASIFTINSQVAGMLENTDVENFIIMDWPNMGNNENWPLLGGSSGLFIPSFAKNVDGALEVLQYLTGEECADIRANAGAVSTIKTSDSVSVDADMMEALSRKTDAIVAHEIQHLTTEIDSAMNMMPANYVLYGDESLEELETYRLDYVDTLE